MKILIADNDAIALSSLAASLEAAGNVVLKAPDGVAATEILKGVVVDAIVSEALMPKMDGIELCLDLRQSKRLRQIPLVIYTSNYSSPEEVNTCLAAGADMVLLKPASPQVLLRVLQGLAIDREENETGFTHVPEQKILRQHNENLVRKLQAKEAESVAHAEALRKSESRFDAIFQREIEGITVISSEGRLLEINPAGLEILQAASLEEAVGQPLFDFAFPEYRDTLWSALSKVFQGEEVTIEFELLGLKGARRWLQLCATPLLDASGASYAAIAFTREIPNAKCLQDRVQKTA